MLAKPPWNTTGVQVESGDLVTVDYVRGQWSAWTTTEDGGRMIGPEGYTMSPGWSNPTYTMPTTNPMSLIARIGGGSAFYVGRHKQFSAPSNGVLYLGANDNMYGDNSGSLVVRIILNRR